MFPELTHQTLDASLSSTWALLKWFLSVLITSPKPELTNLFERESYFIGAESYEGLPISKMPLKIKSNSEHILAMLFLRYYPF